MTPATKPLDADRPYKEASELERAIRACEAYHTVHWDKDGHHYCDFCDQRLPSPGHSADCEPGKAFAKLRHEIDQQLAQAAEREGWVAELVRIVKTNHWPTEDPDTHEIGVWLDREGTKALDDLLAAIGYGEFIDSLAAQPKAPSPSEPKPMVGMPPVEQPESLRSLCERVLVAYHMRFHGGLQKPLFEECNEGFCKEWRDLR